MFKSKQNKIRLGLDISDVSLKMIQFSPAGEVQAFSDMAIPKDVIVGDTIRNPKLLAETIRQAAQNPKFGKITTPYVVGSIAETKSFVRVIQMQKVTEDEAAEAVPWEAEQYIPMPVGQVYLDWVILPTTTSEDPAKMTVLISASPRDHVDQYVAVLKSAGLRPVALEVESQATARSLVAGAYLKETVLIADIDTVRTSLIIYDHGILQFTSSLPVAGNVFTEAVAKALTVETVEAEKLKREIGLDPAVRKGAVRKALLPVLNNLVTEIKNTIRFYEEHSGQTGKISRLLLAGGSSKLRHLPSFLQEKFAKTAAAEYPLRSVPGLRVELGNPWGKVLKKGQTPPMSREDSLSFATVIGLALREVE